MAERLILTFERDFFVKLRQHAKKKGFESVPTFIHEVLRRQLYWKKHASMKDPENLYLDKFSRPTKETRKIMRSITAK